MEEPQTTPSGKPANDNVLHGDDGTHLEQLVRANDDAKVPVAQYHIYRRHFVFFCMSRHAFLETKPEVTVEGLEKLIGTSSFRRMFLHATFPREVPGVLMWQRVIQKICDSASL